MHLTSSRALLMTSRNSWRPWLEGDAVECVPAVLASGSEEMLNRWYDSSGNKNGAEEIPFLLSQLLDLQLRR